MARSAHSKFTWRFLALNRHDKKAKPCRLSVEAATEREARRILAPHFILSLAARLPVTAGIEISSTPAGYIHMNTPRNHGDITTVQEVRHA